MDEGALSVAHPAERQHDLHHPAGDLHEHERPRVHERRVPVVGHDLLHER